MRRYVAVAAALSLLTAACASSPPSASPAIIAFSSDRDNEGPLEDFTTANFEIYTMTADGRDITRITHDPRVDFYPRWSASGTEIAFISNRDTGTESMDLYVINLETEEIRRLTTTGDVFGHEWSPDGSSLAYAQDSGSGSMIRVVSADGSDDRLIIDGSWPSFSPDGSQILFTQGEFFEERQTLAIVDVDSGSVTAVPVDLDNSSESMWSPQGDRIAFMSNPNGYAGGVASWDEEIYVAAVDGSEVVRVSNRPGNDHWPPSWSDDGRCLTWQGDDPDPNNGFSSDVIVTVVDGGTPINVTADSGFIELFPDWSPGTCPL